MYPNCSPLVLESADRQYHESMRELRTRKQVVLRKYCEARRAKIDAERDAAIKVAIARSLKRFDAEFNSPVTTREYELSVAHQEYERDLSLILDEWQARIAFGAEEAEEKYQRLAAPFEAEQERILDQYLNDCMRAVEGGNKDQPTKTSASMRYRRMSKMPSTFTKADKQAAIDYFEGKCAVCGRPPGIWHFLAMDHWIPVASPNCPGTVPWNMVPLCHNRKGGKGNGGCNNSKHDRDPKDWLIDKLGPRKGRAIIRRIEAYLNSRKAEGSA